MIRALRCSWRRSLWSGHVQKNELKLLVVLSDFSCFCFFPPVSSKLSIMSKPYTEHIFPHLSSPNGHQDSINNQVFSPHCQLHRWLCGRRARLKPQSGTERNLIGFMSRKLSTIRSAPI